MAESIVFNNATYIIPDPGESNWGQNLTNYFVAIPQGCYQLSGGTKALTADLSFGSNFGIFAKYFTSVTTTPATAGVVRLAKTDAVEWMNNAGGGNLALAINASDQLTFNGNIILTDAVAVTAKSFLYGDAAGLIASTSNPTNGQLLIGSTGAIPVVAALTGTSNEIIITNGAGTITLSTPQAIGTGSSPTFDHITLAKTSSQIILGTTNTVTLSSTAPASSRVYTFPDAGGAANIVLDAGNYTISGTWGFSNTITLASSKAIIFTDNGSQAVTMKATNSTTSWTFNLPTTSGTNTYVLQTDGSGNTSWVAPSGSGTVNSGTATHLAYYATTTTAVSDGSGHTISGAYTFSGGAGAITMSSSTIAMGANKITGLANGSAATDAAAFGQVPIFVDWTTFTPTGSWSSNTTYTGKYRRVGGVMECFVHIALSGAPTSASLTITIPLSLSIDVTNSLANGTTTMFGQGGGSSSGGFGFVIAYNGTTSVQVLYDSALTNALSLVDATHPVTWGNGNFIDLHFSVPISTWTAFT